MVFRYFNKTSKLSTIHNILYTLWHVYITLHVCEERYICIDCERVDIKASNANTGILGTVIGFIIGVCPACFSLIGVLLPLGVSITLSAYSSYFTLLSIAIILFSIFKLGGVKKMR